MHDTVHDNDDDHGLETGGEMNMAPDLGEVVEEVKAARDELHEAREEIQELRQELRAAREGVTDDPGPAGGQEGAGTGGASSDDHTALDTGPEP